MPSKETIDDFLRRIAKAREIAEKLPDPSKRAELLEFIAECEELGRSITPNGP